VFKRGRENENGNATRPLTGFKNGPVSRIEGGRSFFFFFLAVESAHTKLESC